MSVNQLTSQSEKQFIPIFRTLFATGASLFGGEFSIGVRTGPVTTSPRAKLIGLRSAWDQLRTHTCTIAAVVGHYAYDGQLPMCL